MLLSAPPGFSVVSSTVSIPACRGGCPAAPRVRAAARHTPRGPCQTERFTVADRPGLGEGPGPNWRPGRASRLAPDVEAVQGARRWIQSGLKVDIGRANTASRSSPNAHAAQHSRSGGVVQVTSALPRVFRICSSCHSPRQLSNPLAGCGGYRLEDSCSMSTVCLAKSAGCTSSVQSSARRHQAPSSLPRAPVGRTPPRCSTQAGNVSALPG